METKTWKHILTIPEYLILEISDSGMEENYEADGELIDKDDLRVSVVLSGGMVVVLPERARIVLQESGDVWIEVLR